jgi:hypothetical protein
MYIFTMFSSLRIYIMHTCNSLLSAFLIMFPLCKMTLKLFNVFNNIHIVQK